MSDSRLGSDLRHPRPLARSLAVSVALALVLAAAAPMLAQTESLTNQLVLMLEAELSEEVILEWLADQAPPGAPLAADDLVALKKAGASDDLLKRILAFSRSETPAVPEAPAAVAPPSLPPTGATSPSPPAPALPGATPTGVVAPVSFYFSYLIQIEEFEVASDRPWDLYVYLNGIPVTYMGTAAIQNRDETMEFSRTLPAGSYSLLVTQERHFKQGGRWQHEARVARPPFSFELAPEVPARLEVEFHERLMDYQDPIIFKLTQGQQIVDSGRVGGKAESWPRLCYDIEASVPDGKKPNRQQRQRLENCVEWKDLWTGRVVPPRREVLDAMAPFDYRPTPKGS